MLFDQYQRSIKRSLILPIFGAMLSGLTWIYFPSAKVTGQTQIPESIEMHVAQPLQWVNSCENDSGNRLQGHSDQPGKSALLKLSLDRFNRSAETVYLPDEAVDIDLSVLQVQSLSAEKGKELWFPLYGPIRDMAPGLGARPLLPGKSTHLEVCFYNSTWVVNLKEPEGRRIPLRGKLRIRAWYFPTKSDWQNNKDARARADISKNSQEKMLGPHVLTLDLDIPCLGAGCRPGCNTPPWILQGEGASTIDISAKSVRGAEINKELARRFPACAEETSAP
jgi:hypothetical protein